MPVFADVIGRGSLLPQAVGPVLGTVAMLRLRALPAALRHADGRLG